MATGEQPLMGSVPTVEVACANSGCSRHGIRSWVRLRAVPYGLAEVPTLICTSCGQPALTVRHWQPRGAQAVDAATAEAPPAPVVELKAARRPGRPRKERA